MGSVLHTLLERYFQSLTQRHRVHRGPSSDSIAIIGTRLSLRLFGLARLDFTLETSVRKPDVAKCVATVRNGTALLPTYSHLGCMLRKKIQKEHENAEYAGVKKEMAKPRMARSARITELNLDIVRISEQPSTTMPGTVDKIIPSSRRSISEKARIAVDGPDHRNQDLRIENTLTDENGDDVKLKKGAHVDVTVTATDVIRRR